MRFFANFCYNIYMQIFSFNIKNRYFLVGVLILLAIVILGILDIVGKKDNSYVLNKSEPGEINRINDSAFGDIASLITQQNISDSLARNESGGGGNTDSQAEPGYARSPIAPGEHYPEYSQISYKYVGEEISLPAKGDVYKRNKTFSYAQDIADSIKGINLDEFSLASLDNASLDSVRLSEEKEFGYSVFLNPKEGSASISTNWEYWPSSSNCDGPRCAETYTRTEADSLRLPEGEMRTLTENDIDKDKVLEIANKFIDRFNIDMSFYGEGEIRSVRFPARYPPQSISIVYPLTIEESSVYDAQGNKAGMFAEVNMSHKKVTHFGSIASSSFSVSTYDIETKAERVIELAEKGGLFGPRYFPIDESEEPAVLELGTPDKVLMHVSRHDGKGSHEEFFIPALGFPVQNPDALKNDSHYLNNSMVIVPLVKGFIEGYMSKPLPMPVDTDAVGAGSSGSAGSLAR